VSPCDIATRARRKYSCFSNSKDITCDVMHLVDDVTTIACDVTAIVGDVAAMVGDVTSISNCFCVHN
jgi:hypothetical protein